MINHQFDIEVAQRYGLHEAIFIAHFQFWTLKNRANGKHQHDGRTWTYNSIKAFAELFPYLSPKQIRTALDNLEAKGVLVTNCFNNSKYDRTKWYAFANETLWLGGQIDLPCRANETALQGKTVNTVIDTVDKGDQQNDLAKKVLDHLNQKANRSYRLVDSTKRLIEARLKEGATVEEMHAVIDAKVGEWLGDAKMESYLRPETLFNATKYNGYAGSLGNHRGDPDDWRSNPMFAGAK